MSENYTSNPLGRETPDGEIGLPGIDPTVRLPGVRGGAYSEEACSREILMNSAAHLPFGRSPPELIILEQADFTFCVGKQLSLGECAT